MGFCEVWFVCSFVVETFMSVVSLASFVGNGGLVPEEDEGGDWIDWISLFAEINAFIYMCV